MNKLDIISQIWNYFQGCANSVEATTFDRTHMIGANFNLFNVQVLWSCSTNTASDLEAAIFDRTHMLGVNLNLFRCCGVAPPIQPQIWRQPSLMGPT